MTGSEHPRICFIPPVQAMIDEFVASVGFGENPGTIRRIYRGEILRLAAKSDAELAAIGIGRRDIPAHVMRHRYPDLAPTPIRPARRR